MNFAIPGWLYAGAAVCALLAVFFWYTDRRRRQALATLVSARLLDELTANFSPGRRAIKRVLFVAAIACLFVALARPRYGFRWQEVHRKGIDIVVALDVSRSMLTQDAKPSRLERAKLLIRDLAELADGDRLALIPFAGSAYVMVPPTLDYDMFMASVAGIAPDAMPLPGTDIATAMRAAADLLEKAKGSRKILLLITDGEDLAGEALAEAKRAAALDIAIYPIGVGSPAGDLIPVPNAGGGVDFLKDEAGNFVKSRLDEETLRKIAEATGGAYVSLDGRDTMENFYARKIGVIPKEELSSRMEKIPLERFGWPLAAGILLLVVEWLTRERRRSFWRRTAPAAVILLSLALPAATRAAPMPTPAEWKEFSALAKKYRDKLAKKPGDPVLNYDFGTAQYKLGNFDAAAGALQKALATDDLKLQNHAYYNFGNTLYRLGEQTEQSAPDDTRKLWQQAIQAYQGALELNPNDKEAKENLEFVRKRLNELPPQQEQQQNQDKQQQDQQQDQQQQQQGQSQEQKGDDKKNEQNNPDQNKQDQNQQGKDQQNKDGQDGKDKNQNQPQQQKPDADKNQKPQDKSGDQGKDDKQKPQQQSPRQMPGGMTKEQAEAALDALKGEEQQYNMSLPNYKRQSADDKKVKRDW